MACNSEYMNPTQKEANSRTVAQHLVYVQNKLGFVSDVEYVEIANSIYGCPIKLDMLVRDLCQILYTLQQTDKPELERIVYDAKNPMSRKLADWWEQHVAADLKRNDREEQLVAEMRNKEYAEYLRLKAKFGE